MSGSTTVNEVCITQSIDEVKQHDYKASWHSPSCGCNTSDESVSANSFRDCRSTQWYERRPARPRCNTSRVDDSRQNFQANPFDPNNINEGNRGFEAPVRVNDTAIPPTPTGFTASAGFTKVI